VLETQILLTLPLTFTLNGEANVFFETIVSIKVNVITFLNIVILTAIDLFAKRNNPNSFGIVVCKNKHPV